ncbi:MAG: pyrimidine/purine nucleoside phosphorylase [Opitutaceae bacterium]
MKKIRIACPGEPNLNLKEIEKIATQAILSSSLVLPSADQATCNSRVMSLPTQFTGVTVHTKANVYFDGKVVSHTVLMPDGAKKTLGLIYPGSYHFGTGAPERMEIVGGACRVTLDGQRDARQYAAGEYFDVAGKSGFTIDVASSICEYICSYLS